MDHEIEAPGRVDVETRPRRGLGPHHRRVPAGARPAAAAGQVPRLRLVQPRGPGRRCATRSSAALTGARYAGWEGLLDEQRAYLDEFWDAADVEVDGDAELQQAVRFGLFHVLQAGARAERRAIPAKGLTGPGLRRARVLGHRDVRAAGARPTPCRRRGRGRAALAPRRPSTRPGSGPARSGWPGPRSRGGPSAAQECSGYWPAGTAAFHVNADIAAAVERLSHRHRGRAPSGATCGVEILVETARLWMSLGHHEPGRAVAHRRRHRPGRVHRGRGRQHLHEPVPRPRNLAAAADAVDRHPQIARAARASTRGGGDLAGRGRGRARPVRRAAAVHQQSAHFTDLPEWDFDRTTPTTRCCCTRRTSTSTAGR